MSAVLEIISLILQIFVSAGGPAKLAKMFAERNITPAYLRTVLVDPPDPKQ